MAEIVEMARIARPAADVWATMADFGGISRWASNVDHSSLTTEQPDGVGAQRRVQVGRSALLEQIIEWEPGRRLGYRIDGLPPVIRSLTNTWELEESDGSTTVTLRSRIDAGSRPPQLVVARMAGRALAKTSREMLTGLKTHLEGTTP